MSAHGDQPRLWTLGLPLRDRNWVWLACLSLLSLYVLTMARDFGYYDSGELALSAVQLGLGHPPGQPLYTMLGHLLSQLPFWSPLFGVTLMSALPGALTVIPATSLAQRLLEPDTPVALRRVLAWLLAAVALHPALWESATRIEVYALATFFAVWAVARLAGPGGRARVLQAAIALGLCASVNPMIALCIGLSVAPAISIAIVRRQLPASVLLVALGGGLLGLVPYAYVPLVAQRSDVMIWGAPRNLEQLWFYLSLRDYAHNQALTLSLWLSHLWQWLLSTFQRGLAQWFLLGVVGHCLLGRRSPLGRAAAPLSLALLSSVISFNVVFSLEVPDYDGYLASALWPCAAGGLAFATQARALPRKRLVHVLLVVLAVSAVLSPPQLWSRSRHRDHVARMLAQQVLAEAPRDAIVVANLDVFAGGLFYLQQAEALRRDVVVLAYGLAGSSWHWQQLHTLHPQLSRFALSGPGGRAARVRRFLDAQQWRAVLVESIELAGQLALRVCPGGLYLRSGDSCVASSGEDGKSAAELLGRARDSVDDGSPLATQTLSQVAYRLGDSLWRLGASEGAYRVILAGVPRRLLPEAALNPPQGISQVPPLTGALPTWRRPVALGDPARNLFVASAIAHAAGDPERAQQLRHAAALEGLPEALE